MMMSNLPHELLADILFRIPATSLSRLRSTCKRWNLLINGKLLSKKKYLILMLTEKFRLSLLHVSLYNGVPSLEVKSGCSLMDQSYSYQVDIFQVSHCDGLLLCTLRNESRIVVWNPCTGQNKWIKTSKNRSYLNFYDFVIGYHQAKKSGDKRYKILSYKYHNYGDDDQEFEFYDINSDSWRILNVTPIPHYRLTYSHSRVSLKGKTYWFGYDSKEEHFGLISFDYTTERLDRLSLPYNFNRYKDLHLSVVKEEKLSVFVQRSNTIMKEIWVTNEIDDETKEMSWNKLLEVKDVSGCDICLLFDQDMRIVINCMESFFSEQQMVMKISVVDEDNEATQVSSINEDKSSTYWPFFYNYVPGLTRIQ